MDRRDSLETQRGDMDAMRAVPPPAFASANPDFCVEVEDDESRLLQTGVAQTQDQNNRLMDVYKKTQQNRT